MTRTTRLSLASLVLFAFAVAPSCGDAGAATAAPPTSEPPVVAVPAPTVNVDTPSPDFSTAVDEYVRQVKSILEDLAQHQKETRR